MQVLSIVSTFEPHKYGGAEVSARNLMNWSMRFGHSVAVYTMAGEPSEEQRGDDVNGIKVWRYKTEKPYPYWANNAASKVQKASYYFRDHLDPRNRTRMRDVLDTVKPDIIFMHVLAGLGWNGAREIAARNIPTIYFMHDLNLVCANGGMFKAGSICDGWCGSCRLISKSRFDAISSIPRLGFCSPSLANLERAASFLPIKARPHAVIPNPNIYPLPARVHVVDEALRVIYIGRIHSTKGIDTLIEACAAVAGEFSVTLQVIGSGPDEDRLRTKWSDASWLAFRGHLNHQEISDCLAESDICCAPSIWPENYPGVVAHALGQGVPVIGSNIGGIPEMVQDGVNGRLVEPGNVPALRQILIDLATNPEELMSLREKTNRQRNNFDPERNASRIWAFVQDVRGSI